MSDIRCPRCQGSGIISPIRHSTKGERNGNSSLCEAEVIKIRAMHKDYSTYELSKMFQVSSSTISDVISFRTWAHVEVDYNKSPALD